MASIKLKLNKQRRSTNGTYPLVFQIIHQRRKSIYYTKYRLFQQQFNDLTYEVEYCESSFYSLKEIEMMNRELKRELKRLQSRVRKLERMNEPYSLDDIVDSKKKKSSHCQFLQYMAIQIERKKSMGRNGIAAAYYSTYVSIQKYLNTLSARKKDFNMEEINSKFVVGYETFLYKEGVAENTVKYYLRNFRTIYNLAFKDGYKLNCSHPFTHIHTRPCKTVKRALSKEEMKALSVLDLLDNPQLRLSCDLYLFSFYAQGMAFVDIVFLKKKNICNGLLTYSRHKSKQLIRIVVTPQMQELIYKYANNNEYIFPIINPWSDLSEYDQYRLALGEINRNLKKIAKMVDIDIPLTTYTARHTWATLARNSGAPVSAISAGLGHTSEEMTRIYLKEFDQGILAKINSVVTNL